MPGVTEENHEKLAQDSRFSGGDLNLRPTEYEAGMFNHSTTTFRL